MAKKGSPVDLDAQLADVARAVSAGAFYETTWETFRWAFFRDMSDEEAIAALRAWGARHGIAVRRTKGKTQLGGKVFDVLWVRLLRK